MKQILSKPKRLPRKLKKEIKKRYKKYIYKCIMSGLVTIKPFRMNLLKEDGTWILKAQHLSLYANIEQK
jgi:hypothetical protein